MVVECSERRPAGPLMIEREGCIHDFGRAAEVPTNKAEHLVRAKVPLLPTSEQTIRRNEKTLISWAPVKRRLDGSVIPTIASRALISAIIAVDQSQVVW